MAETKSIALARLLLDSSNPRLGDETKSQPDTIRAMLLAQGDKLVELAEDIIEHGLSPLDGFLVMPVEGSTTEYVVLEGNRRATALKLLVNPKLGAEVLKKAQVTKLERLAKTGEITNDTKVPCAVVKRRDDGEAVHWLRLRHGGEMDGAGLVRWGAADRERFEGRTAGKVNPELDVFGLMTAAAHLSGDDASRIKLTNLQRLLRDEHVRDVLGIEIDRKQGLVTSHYPKAEVMKGLSALAKKMVHPEFTVYDIYKAGNRKEFMGKFKASELPNPKTKLSKPQPLEAGAGGAAGGGAGGGGGKGGGKKPTTRKHVAPSKPALKISEKRIKDIYIELQSLHLEHHTNSGGVMLRVFLELTVVHYLEFHKLPQVGKLAHRLSTVRGHLKKTGVMTDDQLKAVSKAISDPGFLATSIDALHTYVHDKEFSPTPRDVRITWDNLQGFFVNIWQ